jgi:hypothetical protein
MEEKVKKIVNKIGYKKLIDSTGLTMDKILSMLGKDWEDVETQLEITKNFVYFNDLTEALFIEVVRNDGDYIIKPHINPGTAVNTDSWFDSHFCNMINKYVPFKVEPSWSKYNPECKIFINSETFKSDEDDEEMSLQESIKRILNEETQRISNEQLIEIFYSRLTKKGKLNFKGIILIPELEDDGQKRIIFNIDNPNDVSYSQAVIENYIDKMFNKFIKIFGLDRFKIQFKFDSYLIVNTPEEFYINKTDYDNIRQSIVNVKKFRIKYFNKKVDLIGDVKLGSDEFWVNVSGSEVNLTINARLTNFKLTNNDNQVTELSDDELNDFLNEGSNGDKYIDYIQDELYDEAMNYIWNMTTVTDQDNMYINVDLV